MKITKKEVIETWNKIASVHRSYRRKSWPEVQEFFKYKKPILDIGCGSGSYLRKQDIGMDASFEMCKLAKKNCLTICGDATNLPIKSNKFNRVFSKAVIHLLPSKKDRLNALKETKRVLKPKGNALLTVIYLKGLKYFFKKNTKMGWGKAIVRKYHLFSKRELKNLGKKVFNYVEVKVGNRTGKHKNLFLYIKKNGN